MSRLVKYLMASSLFIVVLCFAHWKAMADCGYRGHHGFGHHRFGYHGFAIHGHRPTPYYHLYHAYGYRPYVDAAGTSADVARTAGG